MLVDNRRVAAVIIDADWVLIILEDDARIICIAAASQFRQDTAFEIISTPGISDFADSFIVPDSTIGQPQIAFPGERKSAGRFPFRRERIIDNAVQDRIGSVQAQVDLGQGSVLITAMDCACRHSHIPFNLYRVIGRAGYCTSPVLRHVHIDDAIFRP